ncbi:MAG: nucleotidyltransferase domain-containing protein [Nanoarchaeota archaeon]|nr:nucleotidyltransferase domain-containing protein [Nanoarchaeota archaeon]
MKPILNAALREIKPTPAEEKEVKKRISGVVSQIQKLLPETKVLLGGSGEKGTWLRNAHDADIFVQFPKGSTGLSDILERKLAKSFKLDRLHGSRDYFQTRINEFLFEIVPIIAIKKAEEAENITDVSPLHAKWVKKHAKLADDIRLAKQFFKAAGAYGAESHISGFSGYMCEVLTVYYKGFRKLVKGITSWKSGAGAKTIVDVEKAHAGKNILFELDKSKTVGPLIVVDPVQPSRNAAAAVSLEKYLKVIGYAKKFLARPSKEAFTIHPLEKSLVRKKAGNDDLFFFEAAPLIGKIDVVGCKLLKVYEHVLQGLLKRGFTVKESGWEWKGNARFYFIVKKETLSPELIVRGPPSSMMGPAEAFRKAHRDTFEKDKTWYAREKRAFRTAASLVSSLLQEQYVQERVKRVLP